MVKKFSLILLILVFTFLTACSSNTNVKQDQTKDQVENNKEAATGEPKYGGTLTISDLGDAKTLDPHKATNAQSMRYIENMYNTLFRYKDGTYGEIEGELVKDYKISEDGKVYTFTLYDGVKFHNGDSLTSQDVKYSIERIKENEVRAAQFLAVESIDTPDPQTVIVNLSEPVAPFLTFLAYPMNVVVNKSVVERNGGSLDNADAGMYCTPKVRVKI